MPRVESSRPPAIRPDPARPSPVRGLVALTVTPLLRWVIAADSVPAGSPRRSACAGCGTPVGLRGPLRALSPAGRCGVCSARVGAPPYTVELAAVAAVAALLLAARPTCESVAFAWWAAFAVPLVFIDIAVHRLPDRLTYPAAVGTWALLGIAAIHAGTGIAAAWPRALLAALAVAALFAASTLLLGRRGFGLGDAKLALGAVAVLGWLGWAAVLFGLLIALVGSAVCGVVLLATRRIGWSGHLPFGPFLILATFVTLALPAL